MFTTHWPRAGANELITRCGQFVKVTRKVSSRVQVRRLANPGFSFSPRDVIGIIELESLTKYQISLFWYRVGSVKSRQNIFILFIFCPARKSNTGHGC